MKKLVLLVFALAGLAAFAGTCVIKNVGQTEIDGDLVYGAEMANELGVDFLGHKFIVGFIDEDGEVISTKTPTQCLRTFQAGESNFYSTDSNLDPDDVDLVLSRMVLDSSLKLGTALDNDLAISSVAAVRNGTTLTVTGNVKNDGNDDYEDVIVCIVLFNDDGDVVLVAITSKFDLNADEDEDFTVTADVPNKNADVDKVSVYADAENAEEDNELTEPVKKTGNSVKTATPTITGTPPTSTPTNTATPTATNTPTTP
jgi:hypothetical protein